MTVSDVPPENSLSGSGSAPRPRRGLLLVLSGIVVVAVIAAIWFFAMEPGRSGGPPSSVVAEFSGTSDQTTAKFSVRPGWQIQWQTDGETFKYSIAGDLDIGKVIDQQGPGSGITSPVPSGTFFLEITAKGPWQIKIIQGS